MMQMDHITSGITRVYNIPHYVRGRGRGLYNLIAHLNIW